jgi:hypothetical protein
VADKTYFGATQKAWIKQLISKAASDITTKGVIITATQVWNYNSTEYEGDLVQQNTLSVNQAFNADKAEIGDAFLNSGINYLNPNSANYKPVMMVVGEEMLAFDNGKNNQATGKFPVVVCGSVEGDMECKGGPYSHASFTQSMEQFCTFNVITDVSVPTAPKVCIVVQGSIRRVPDKDTVDEVLFVYNTCLPNETAGFNRKCPIGTGEKLLNFAVTLGVNIILFAVFFVMLYRISTKAFNFNTLDSNATQ